jgi:hypothetical protein
MLIVRKRRPINPDQGPGSKETVLAITSLNAHTATPADLAAIARGHWASEVRHRILDVTFGEDACQARAGSTPENLSTLRDIAIEAIDRAGHANTAHARRHYTHRPEHVLDLYGL